MKTLFKILGVLVILTIGASLIFYGQLNRGISHAEKAYNSGDYETAESIYSEVIKKIENRPLSKIQFLKREIEKINLNRAWAFYRSAYYNSEKYKLAKEIADKELDKKKRILGDQFYNLRTLIYWQEGVDLFIKLGQKAAKSKELNQLIEDAKSSSAEAVKINNGKDWDIKYNYEFLRQPKKKLMQNMQQMAKQKKKAREMQGKVKQMAEEKKKNSDQEKAANQGEKEKAKVEKNKEGDKKGKAKILVPTDKKKKSKENPEGSQEKKKKIKG